MGINEQIGRAKRLPFEIAQIGFDASRIAITGSVVIGYDMALMAADHLPKVGGRAYAAGKTIGKTSLLDIASPLLGSKPDKHTAQVQQIEQAIETYPPGNETEVIKQAEAWLAPAIRSDLKRGRLRTSRNRYADMRQMFIDKARGDLRRIRIIDRGLSLLVEQAGGLDVVAADDIIFGGPLPEQPNGSPARDHESKRTNHWRLDE